MERLRAAIEQARKTRAESDALAPKPAKPAGDNAQPSNVVPVDGGLAADSQRKPAKAKAKAPAKGESSALLERWEALPKPEIKQRRLRKSRLIVSDIGPERAAIDMLRTRLLTMIEKEGWKRIAITSPTMACGKSTTTLNLAYSLARLAELRTVVVEADMRRPSMAKMLGLKGKSSTSDVLRGKVDFADQAIRLAPNVAVSLNYGVAKNPAELLHRGRTAEILEQIEEDFEPDIVLFDMSPMMHSDDTLGFLKNVDCAILVAMAESSTLNEIDVCESELAAHTNVAGVVLNRCRYTGGRYGYGYGEY